MGAMEGPAAQGEVPWGAEASLPLLQDQSLRGRCPLAAVHRDRAAALPPAVLHTLVPPAHATQPPQHSLTLLLALVSLGLQPCCRDRRHAVWDRPKPSRSQLKTQAVFTSKQPPEISPSFFSLPEQSWCPVLLTATGFVPTFAHDSSGLGQGGSFFWGQDAEASLSSQPCL